MNALSFYKIETYEVSKRYIAPCFVNGLEAYDSEINLAFDENLISNEYAVKLCLDYKVKKGQKLVKKELVVALKGELYFVKFIINPEEDDVEPGVNLGRSFMRLAKGIVDFNNGVIVIYPKLDLFEDDYKKTEKSPNDWDQLLDFNFDDIPKCGEELPSLVCKMGKSNRNKKRSMENLSLFYQDIGPSLSTDKVELDGRIVKEEEEAVKRIKGEALKEKDDPGAFIFPFRLEEHDSDDEEDYQIKRNTTMATMIEQQVALDEALVPSTKRLRIGRSNFRLPSDIQSKEPTLQVVHDVLRGCPFFKAFLVTTDVPAIYMQEFWATAYVHQHSIRFKMDSKKNIVDLEAFREMLHISPMVPGQSFDELPFKDEILDFLWNTKVYKEYYACATGEAAPKPKASARRKRGGSDSSTTPLTAVASPRPIITVAAAPRLTTTAKGKQPARATSPNDPSEHGGSSINEGIGSKPEVLDVPSDDSKEEISWNSFDEEDVDAQDKGRDDDEGKKNDESDARKDDDDDQDCKTRMKNTVKFKIFISIKS
nr:hypothetical protein [Tanacetum cinerariifolium]